MSFLFSYYTLKNVEMKVQVFKVQNVQVFTVQNVKMCSLLLTTTRSNYLIVSRLYSIYFILTMHYPLQVIV